jgi:large subunit ribosomal protein L18
MSVKQIKKERRQKKIRAKIHGTAARPRLSVFRSINHIYAQLIDDNSGKVLAIASDKDLKAGKKAKSEIAKEVGKIIAKVAAEKKIDTVVFDRAGFLFHGRIKSLAEGAREGGLKF